MLETKFHGVQFSTCGIVSATEKVSYVGHFELWSFGLWMLKLYQVFCPFYDWLSLPVPVMLSRHPRTMVRDEPGKI